MVVQGRSWRLDDGTADPRPVRLTHVVGTGGSVASVLHHLGEAAQPRTTGGESDYADVCDGRWTLPRPPAEHRRAVGPSVARQPAGPSRPRRARPRSGGGRPRPPRHRARRPARAAPARRGRRPPGAPGRRCSASRTRPRRSCGPPASPTVRPVEDLTQRRTWMDERDVARPLGPEATSRSADDYLDELADLVAPQRRRSCTRGPRRMESVLSGGDPGGAGAPAERPLHRARCRTSGSATIRHRGVVGEQAGQQGPVGLAERGPVVDRPADGTVGRQRLGEGQQVLAGDLVADAADAVHDDVALLRSEVGQRPPRSRSPRGRRRRRCSPSPRCAGTSSSSAARRRSTAPASPRGSPASSRGRSPRSGPVAARWH